MRDGELDGMQDFDSVILKMIEREQITLEDGLSFATNQNNLLLQLSGFRHERRFCQRRKNQRAAESALSLWRLRARAQKLKFASRYD
jgi:twitching motility protein PilT